MEIEFSLAEIEEQSHAILQRWQQSKHELEGYFKNREGEKALPVMKDSIQLFHEYLYISNGKKDKGNVNAYLVKPVNVQERLNFIESKPRLFHSYVQLAELFAEQEKLVAKNLALYKIKNKRPD